MRRAVLAVLAAVAAAGMLAVDAGAVPVPQGLSAVASGYRVDLTWTQAPGASVWQVQRRVKPDGAFNTIDTVYVRSYVDQDVVNGGQYEYRVRARDSNYTYSAFSTAVSAAVSVVVAAPQGLLAVSNGYRVDLSWTQAPGASVWEVQKRVKPNGVFNIVDTVYARGYEDRDVDNGGQYEYRVRARDSNHTYSAFSAPASATVSVAVPVPQSFTAAQNGSSVELSWSYGAGVNTWEVQRRTHPSGSFVTLENVYSASYRDYGVVGGTTYSYRIRARDPYSVWSAYTPERTISIAAPAVAVENRPVNNGLPESPHPYQNSSDNTWTYYGPPDALSIDLTFDPRTATESGWDFISVKDETGNPAPGSPFSGAQLAGRTVRVNGRAAVIRLQTDGSVTNWGFALTSIVPLLPPAPPAPSALKPSPSDTVAGPIELAWSFVPQATYYLVEYSSDSRSWLSVQTSASSLAPMGMGNGSWTWRVRAGNGRGLGPASSASFFRAVPGFSVRMSRVEDSRDRQRYRLDFQAFRDPPPARLQLSGLPPQARWRFDPEQASGTGSSTLVIEGMSAVPEAGNYSFTVLAEGAALEGARGVVAVSGDFSLEDAHAYPNPSYNGAVRIRARLPRPPTALKLRIYGLSGEPVREVSENAPFSRFILAAPGVYEYAWDGANDSGRRVAGEKYLFWLEARNPSESSSAKGIFTLIRK